MLARVDTSRRVPGTETPANGARRLAAVTSYDDLVIALRARVDELQISRALVDEISGLPLGLTGKVLGIAQVKRLGWESLWLVTATLGLRLVLEIDEELTAEMQRRYEPRHDRHRRVGVLRKRISAELISAVAREMGRRGAEARRQRRAGRRP
jgi:hypothetical protein